MVLPWIAQFRVSLQMSRATPQMRAFAKRLAACEAAEGRSSEAISRTAFPISEKMRSPLTTLLGSGGFRALLSRALALASAEAPWLRSVQVKANGALEEGGKPDLLPSPAEQLEGRLVLLAQLLGLLVTFIGPGLTSHLVGEIWPNISLSDLDLETRDKNEKK
jgi:hypothetical protein